MKVLLNPIFLASVLLAGANQILERNGVHIPLVHSYLDDLLCFPIVLTIGLAVYRIILPNYTLTGWHIWPLLIIYAFVFEWYLPQTSSVYTADPLDIVAYFIGILIFQKWINPVEDEAALLKLKSEKE